MKRALTTLLAAFLCLAASAQGSIFDALEQASMAIDGAKKQKDQTQKPNYWTKSTAIDLGFNQTTLNNWAAGGYNTLTLSAGLDAKADYKKNLMSWTNRLQLNYAFLWSADKPDLMQKSNDRMYFESKWAYRAAKESKWNYTASFDFRSQFSDTRDKYSKNEETGIWEGVLKSGFFSPAYTNIALGMEWKPNAWFDISMAPLTGGLTICLLEENNLRKTYGMKTDEDGNYMPYLFQFGSQVKTNMKWIINDVLGYETQLVLFTDYLNKPFEYVRVNWDNKISWQLSRSFKIGASTWLIYDPIVKIDGRQRIQFKEFVSFSFTYTFLPKK